MIKKILIIFDITKIYTNSIINIMININKLILEQIYLLQYLQHHGQGKNYMKDWTI